MAQSIPHGQRSQLAATQYEAQELGYAADYPNERKKLLSLDGEPIGCVRTCETDTHLHIVDIRILPEYQNQGYGTAVLRRFMEVAARERRPVRLRVQHDNPARHLYARLGFHYIASDGVYIAMEWVPDTLL